MADGDVGKLFVGGISRETTEDTLKQHFSKYGVVSTTIIAKDRLTNTPRGFGFVTFFDPSSIHLVLRDHHIISGRTVEVKKAIPRNRQQTSSQQEQLEQQNQQQFYQSYFPQGGADLGRSSNGSYGSNNGDQYLRTKKIFVGGLSANLTEEEFKSCFEQFGRITDIVVMHDNNTNRPRGFGFITFDSEQVVENIMQKSHHELAGKRVDVKRAVPREATKNSNTGNSSRPYGTRFSPVPGYKEDNHFSPRGPRYGGCPTQPPFGTTNPGFYYNGVYNGGYPVGGYGFYGYGMPMVAPRSSWNSFGAMGVHPVAYGTGYYPTNVNGGVAMMRMVSPYNIFDPPPNGESHQNFVGNNQAPAKDARAQMSGGRSDVDGSSFKSGKGAVNIRKNSRVGDSRAQPKVSSVSRSN